MQMTKFKHHEMKHANICFLLFFSFPDLGSSYNLVKQLSQCPEYKSLFPAPVIALNRRVGDFIVFIMYKYVYIEIDIHFLIFSTMYTVWYHNGIKCRLPSMLSLSLEFIRKTQVMQCYEEKEKKYLIRDMKMNNHKLVSYRTGYNHHVILKILAS